MAESGLAYIEKSAAAPDPANDLPTDAPAAGVSDHDVAFVLELAHSLHAAGTPAHRLEAAMTEVSERLGVTAAFISTPNVIIVAVGPPLDQRLSLLRVEPGDQGLEALERLDGIVSQVAQGRLPVAAAVAQVRAIRGAPRRWGWATTTLAYVLSSATAARFLGGGWREVATAATIGLGVGAIAQAGRRNPAMQRVVEPAAALFAAVLAPAAALLLGRMSTLTATIAGLISLMPGLALTTALTELTTRHLAAGATRLAGVMTVFLTLGLGVALGHQAADLLPHLAEARHPARLAPWTEWLALGVAPLAAAVHLGSMPKQIKWIFISGVLAWLTARWGGRALGPEMGAFLATLLLGGLANLYSRWLDRPASVLVVPGIMMLVPGSVGFRSVAWLLQQDVVHGLKTAVDMAVIAVALVGGLLFANVIVPPRRGG